MGDAANAAWREQPRATDMMTDNEIDQMRAKLEGAEWALTEARAENAELRERVSRLTGALQWVRGVSGDPVIEDGVNDALATAPAQNGPESTTRVSEVDHGEPGCICIDEEARAHHQQLADMSDGVPHKRYCYLGPPSTPRDPDGER